MVGPYRTNSDDLSAAESAPPTGTDAAELVAQIRQLAGADPAGVQQVVADVLAALDRAAGGALRDQLPDGLLFAGGSDRAESAPDGSTSAT
jgi:hypothetical protein